MKRKQHIKEELSPDDMKKIARVFFDLYRKKGAWASL
jgi:RNA polymerase-interacting CarD/CdnL/TRCF family regulator